MFNYHDCYYMNEAYRIPIKASKVINKPEHRREKAQNRNEKCACGSGKKYKKCCGV